MDESIKLWREIVNSKWFTDVPVHLVFTKVDLLPNSLQQEPNLSVCPAFTDFKTSNSSLTRDIN